MSLKKRIEHILSGVVKKLYGVDVTVFLEEPKEESFGDYTSEVCFPLSKEVKKPPVMIAREIAENLIAPLKPIIASINVVGGYLNFTLRDSALQEYVYELAKNPEYATSIEADVKERINVEFVSANPTGPLHVAQARAAAVGDTLVKLLRKRGHDVIAEYYVNDSGTQIENLKKSMMWRLGKISSPPEDGYLGDYLISIAEKASKANVKEEDLGKFAATLLFNSQLDTLLKFRVKFDEITRESWIRESGHLEKVKEKLSPYLYFSENALYFRTTDFGDDKDRVLVRSTGEPTYFFVDLAYHLYKMERRFSRLINLWGPDHHGYIPRMQAGIEALGFPKDKFSVIIVQQVTLKRGDEKIKMSKRRGTFYTMDDLIEEVGVDAARFFFLLRSADSPLDFDLNLAKTLGVENPVYYVQYVHARVNNLILFGREKGLNEEEGDPTLLTLKEERSLMRRLLYWPDIVERAAEKLEPHQLPHTLLALSRHFHNYYQKVRIVSDDKKISEARLLLAKAVGNVVSEGLSLLGVEAPERM